MTLKNNYQSFGTITKLLHLIISILFIVQFVLVYWRDYVSNANPLNMQLIMLHKSFGFTLLFLGLFFIIWRLFNVKPLYPLHMAKWEKFLANTTHYLLYLTILIMPLTGVMMSFLSGRGIKWFGLAVPNYFNIDKELAGLFYSGHVWLSYAIIGLVILHVAGALKHYYLSSDNVMQRMWKF